MKKHITIGFIIFMSLTLMLWLVTKTVVTQLAAKKADTIIETVYRTYQPTSEHEKIIALTRHVFKNFKNVSMSESFALRLRGYLTNKRLPAFIRLGNGVIETLIAQGQCDNASRMLAFILKREGYESVQWNMIGHDSGHSALLVTLPNGDQGYVDPFYGYVAQHNEQLIHPQLAQTLGGRALVALDDTAYHKYYKNFSNLMMAAEGKSLVIRAVIPTLNSTKMALGDVNNSSADVRQTGKELNMTPYWHYMGHKYNREWVRVLEAVEPVKVTITLTEAAQQNIIISDKAPTINGKSLSWILQAGESLSFYDGKAKISFKRFNSFIDVDQIIFEAI